jgi:hypothetical protein
MRSSESGRPPLGSDYYKPIASPAAEAAFAPLFTGKATTKKVPISASHTVKTPAAGRPHLQANVTAATKP